MIAYPLFPNNESADNSATATATVFAGTIE